MIKRYATAVTSGTLMTFALLFVMQLLISMQPTAIAATTPPRPLVYAEPPPEMPVQPRPKRIDRKRLTDVDPVPLVGRPSVDGADMGIHVPRTSGSPALEKFTPMERLDGPLVAIVRVQPSYPASATARELEGYVIVEFDVLSNGTTANIRIVESSHSVFERSSLKAASRFKFKPRIVNGQPQASSGLQNLFRFTMDSE